MYTSRRCTVWLSVNNFINGILGLCLQRLHTLTNSYTLRIIYIYSVCFPFSKFINKQLWLL